MEASASPSTLNPLAPPFISTRPATDDNTPLPPAATAIDPATECLFYNLSTYAFDSDAEFQSGLSAILGHPDRRASPEEIEQNGDLMLKAQCFYFARQNNLPPVAIDPLTYKAWLLRRSRERGSGADTNDTQTVDEGARPSQREHHAVAATAPPTFDTPTSAALEPALSQQTSQPEPPPSHTEPQETQPEPMPTQPASTQLLSSKSSLSSSPLPTDPPPPLPSPSYPTTFNHIVDLITRNQPIPGIETIPNIVLGTANAAPNTVPARRKPWETPQDPPKDDPTKDSTKDSTEQSGDSTKPLYGGLLGPLTRTEASGGVKPVPVQTTTPSWQELAEQGAAGQVAQGGDAPAAHEA